MRHSKDLDSLSLKTSLPKVLLLATLIGACVGCASTRPKPSPATQNVREISGIAIQGYSDNSDSAAFASLGPAISNAYAHRPGDDFRLIATRLQFETLRGLEILLREGHPIPTGASLRDLVQEALEEPLFFSSVERSRFDWLLQDTRGRILEVPGFQQDIDQARNQWSRIAWDPRWDDFKCIIDGLEQPSWLCRTLVVTDLYLSLDVFDPLVGFWQSFP